MGIVAIGIDPDLHDVGVGVVTTERILDLGAVRTRHNLKDEDAVIAMSEMLRQQIPTYFRRARKRGHPIQGVVVESQQVYEPRDHLKQKKTVPRTQDLIHLAQVAGAALSACLAMQEEQEEEFLFVSVPRAAEWKGQVPKSVHQRRVLLDYDPKGATWQWETPKEPSRALKVIQAPSGFMKERLSQDAWGQILDGIGLGRFGAWEGMIPSVPMVRRYFRASE